MPVNNAGIPVVHGGEDVNLTLPYPPSINTYWRHVGPRVLISANGRRYRRAVGDAVLLGIGAGQIAAEPLPGRLAVLVEAAPPDRRARDPVVAALVSTGEEGRGAGIG